MKNRNGFTLVELLAVIAILAILIMIAIPNVIKMFNNAKRSAFETETKKIVQSITLQHMSNSIYNSGEHIYSNCKEGCLNNLNYEDRENLSYFGKTNSNGKIVEFYITDGTFQYSYKGDSLKPEQIVVEDVVANLDKSEIITISNNTVKKGDILIANSDIETNNNGAFSPDSAVGILINKCDNDCQNGTPNSIGLKKVIHSNGDIDYRFTGSSPLNYVTFNNENAGWRIVGVFEVDGVQMVKIVRSFLGNYSWDSSDSSINNGAGVNQWGPSGSYDGADLMKELNGDYLNYNLTENTLWYNGKDNKKEAIFNISNVLKKDAQKYINTVTWYLGGSIDNINVETQYENERGTKTIDNPADGISRTTRWSGKVGLLYSSDYVYACSDIACHNNIGNTSKCKTNNWLYSGLGMSFMTPSYNGSIYIQALYWGAVTHYYLAGGAYLYNAFPVYPTVYIVPTAKLNGEGTKNNPYYFEL